MLVFSNQQYGRYAPDTELELIRFHTLLFGYLLCHISTEVNYVLLSAYITVFDPGGVIVGASFNLFFTLSSIQLFILT